MKIPIKLIIVLLWLQSSVAVAQHVLPYNLNASNGLPSNHIYSMITDSYGYLWIATDKGIVKYNGYKCRKFTTADGLSSDDTWGVIEDLKGRVWIGTISEELGYIQHNKYHKAYLKNMFSLKCFNRLKRKAYSDLYFFKVLSSSINLDFLFPCSV